MLRFKGPLVQLGSAPKSQAYQPRTPTRGQVTPFQLQFEVTRLMEDELRNEKVARSRAVIVKASNDMARALPGFREVREWLCCQVEGWWGYNKKTTCSRIPAPGAILV